MPKARSRLVRSLVVFAVLAPQAGCGEPGRTKVVPVARRPDAVTTDEPRAVTRPPRAIATH